MPHCRGKASRGADPEEQVAVAVQVEIGRAAAAVLAAGPAVRADRGALQ